MSAASVDNTVGALLVGALLSMSLWGVTCVQTYDYFVTNKDRLFRKLIIAVLWMVDTISSAMDCCAVYYVLVTNFDSSGVVSPIPWCMVYHALIAGISNFIIRIMFAERIYKFSGQNVILTSCVVVIAIADFIIAIVSTYLALHPDIVLRYIYATLCLGFLTDTFVTTVLCWLLQSAKTGFRRSNSLVNILMIYTINTGLLVTIDAMVVLITFTLLANTSIPYPFIMWSNKLYFNAYLASLNAREKLRAASNLTVSFSGFQSHVISQANDRQTHKQPMSITLQTTIERRVDDLDKKTEAN